MTTFGSGVPFSWASAPLQEIDDITHRILALKPEKIVKLPIFSTELSAEKETWLVDDNNI